MSLSRSLPFARETSLYLDVVRIVAALLVFLTHFSDPWASGKLFWQIGPFGGDAVMVFFVLSGFVIAHATTQSERSAAVYFVNRASRMYSVAVPAIVLTLACDFVGRRLDPTYTTWVYSDGALWQQLVTCLSFTNEFWHAPSYYPGSDGAYWSLGYEVPYYVMFGAFLFARGAWRVVLPAALLLLAGPGVAALLPIWLLGVGVYRLGRLWHPPEAVGWALFLGAFLLWAVAQFWLRAIGEPVYHAAWSSFLSDYVTAVCVALNFIGAEAIAHRFAFVLRPAARVIRWTAARSFTLYLIHLPILKLCAVMPFWHVTDNTTRLAIVAITALAVLAFGQIFEQRREPWRRLFAGLLSSISPRIAVLRPAR